MMDVASISTGWALVQKQVIQYYGLDAESLYADEQLDISQISNPQYRYPVIPFNRIWQKLEQLTGDCGVGLRAASFVMPTTFNALGMAMWSSSNLQEAMQRLMSYSKLFHSGGSVEVIEHDDCFQMQVTRGVSSDGTVLVTDTGIDCLFAALVNLFSQLKGSPFHADKIELMRSSPSTPELYQQYYHCPVEFAAKQDSIFFDKQDYLQPFPFGNTELASMNDNLALQQLARIDNSDISVKVRQLIQQHLQTGEVNQDMIASQMAMSVRTLQRSLKSQQTSFKKELDATRQELAKAYINQLHLSLGEISYLLGFSIQNNFSRSFKQWFGVGPAEYRKQLAG